jgi:IclR family transcriptional regulator, KDG regulon repressor
VTDGERRESDAGMQSVCRAIAVLESLAGEPTGLGISAIARATGLSKPVVLRLLRTWEGAHYVMKRADGKYGIGWKFYTLATAHSENTDLRESARPYLARLNEKTAETVHFSALVGQEVVYIDKIEGRQAIRVYTAVGRRGPAFATASGKALLAYRSDDFIEAVARNAVPYTPTTITTLEALLEENRRTRERGYSINAGEWHSEVGGVGAPIFTADGEVNASLSVTFPMAGLTEEHLRFLGEQVREAAEGLSEELSGRNRERNESGY